MSSVPNEILEDILLPLDRWTLDAAQFTDGRFLQLIEERMSEVCLRQVNSADFRAPNENGNADWTALIRIDGRQELKIAHTDPARVFADFVQALRSSRVTRLTLNVFVFTQERAALLLQTPIVARELSLCDGNCVELTPAQFQEVLLHFSPTVLHIGVCQLRACQLTDGLIRALGENRVRDTFFRNLSPVDGGSFSVTDDAVVHFCEKEDAPIGQEEDARDFLAVDNGSFTKDVFKRLVEASAASTRKQPFRVVVSPLRIEEEDLREFSQHLSYRQRGQPWQQRIYDFRGEQQGAVAAMDLQIQLDDSDDTLVMNRAQRPHRFFVESDE